MVQGFRDFQYHLLDQDHPIKGNDIITLMIINSDSTFHGDDKTVNGK